MNTNIRYAALLTIILFAGNALAHHSAAVFDTEKTMEVTGTVTKFIYRSPHMIIILDEETDEGQKEWKIEGQSVASLTRMGFDRDSVHEGDKITVKISPMRDGSAGGVIQGLRGADGKAYSMDGSDAPARRRLVYPALMAYVPPPEGETWQMREEKTRPDYLPIIANNAGTGNTGAAGLTAGALDPENLAQERPAPGFDLTGAWQFRGEEEYRANYGSFEFKPKPEMTAKGQAFLDAYLEASAKGERFGDPTSVCYPAGLPRLMTRYGSLMMLQYPTAIYMVSRLNNEYRTIFLDGRERVPENLREPNWGGESLGHWEGDTLIIETEGFTDEEHLLQAGIITGKQLKITERIELINDGNTLATHYTFEDPEHWVGKWNHTKFRDRVLRSDVLEANCIYTDNLSLPGMSTGKPG
jgi:hypothetical protein